MNLLTILLIAVGLAMDAFAVSITSGFTIQKLHIRHALRIAFLFGLFQAVMPVLGWLLGSSMYRLIVHIDHWIAFGLLSFIGIKMIVESFQLDVEKTSPLKTGVLFILAVATSIDALAVGVTFAVLDTAIFTPVVIIGVVTFVMSFCGIYIGEKFGHFFEKKIEIFGGLILIGIGVKILIEHLTA